MYVLLTILFTIELYARIYIFKTWKQILLNSPVVILKHFNLGNNLRRKFGSQQRGTFSKEIEIQPWSAIL